MSISNSQESRKVLSMQSFPPFDATRLQAQTDAAVAVITEAFDKWRGSELALSFNGGKDCTVLLHLLGKLDRLRGLRVVFFDTEHGFPEVTAFMKEMEAYYGFKTECLGSFRPGLQQLVDDGIKAVFLGTRRTDPHGST
jgi:FAD synthetase